MKKNNVYKIALLAIIEGKPDAMKNALSLFYGACPRCKTAFAKRRPDQLFCSKKCNTWASVNRLRQKRKAQGEKKHEIPS